MVGMSRTNGAAMDGLDHIRQSIRDILATPIGTRIGRREYGSHLPDLIEQPMTPVNVLRIYAASALAIARWEDRVRSRRLSLIAGVAAGAARLVIDTDRTDLGTPARARIALPLPL